MKYILFTSCFLFLIAGCGQKSSISNEVKAEKLAYKDGDGKHIIRNLTFPISDSSLAFETPLPGLGPILGGITRFVGDVFAANTNMGKLQMEYTQPIPEIPEELNSVRMKRFFFYMKPQEKGKRWRDWFQRLVFGRGHVTFDFLDKLAVQVSAVDLVNPDNYDPILETKDYNRNEMAELMKIFKDFHKLQETVSLKAAKNKSLMLLRYHSKEKHLDTKLEKYGQIHIMETKRPVETKHFLMDHPDMQGFFKRILILGDSLLLELVKDPIVEESFRMVMNRDDVAADIDQLEVTFIDTCTPQSCLELSVPDVNLIPLATKGNALKLEGVLHAGKVPESFNLKGFVEFEVKVESPI